jgi:glycine/D-amino acid oxidase-like deaminating enzyme
MSDLVKRLRRAKGSELLPKILLGHKNAEIACLEAADRIEELEREVANWREDFRALEKAVVGDTGMSAMLVATQAKLFKPRALRAEAQLAAEKALADRLYDCLVEHYVDEISVRNVKAVGGMLVYRKARGL